MHEMMFEDRTIYLDNFGHLKVIVDDNRDILAWVADMLFAVVGLCDSIRWRSKSASSG
tara:strand:+ start:1016 stop:1189 length:174 start_codon:yes stop_codon:yes gene_type:complete